MCAALMLVMMVPGVALSNSGPTAAPEENREIINWILPHLLAEPTPSQNNNIHKYSALYRRYFQSQLTQFSHREEKMPLARFLKKARSGKEFCLSGMVRTPEREKYLVYSDPMARLPLPHVYVRGTTANRLGLEDGQVSLAWLMDQPGIRAVFQRARSYGPLDEIIAARIDQPGFLRSTVLTKTLAEMLALGRVDFFIEYPVILDSITVAGKYIRFRVLRVKEQPETMPVHIACAKTPFGRRVVQRISEIIANKKDTRGYRDVYTAQSLTIPKSTRRLLEQLHDDFATGQ